MFLRAVSFATPALLADFIAPLNKPFIPNEATLDVPQVSSFPIPYDRGVDTSQTASRP